MVFQLTGARLVRSKNGSSVWVCSRPGTTALCRVGDTFVSEILGARTEAWQRELLSHIGTPHLGISDPQNTQRPFELTGAWKLFEEVGLKTAALIQKNARQLRNASRGRGLDGRQLTALAATPPPDGYLQVSSDEARETARLLARTEGVFGGFSGGANVAAAADLLRGDHKGGVVACVICDSGLKYLSTDLWPD